MIDHVCKRCGHRAAAPADGMPLAWSLVVDDDDRSLLCERCTRAHIRDIEGKLDEGWWT